MDRRRSTAPPPGGGDRRRGDRRAGQAAVLAHRRESDVRLDAAGAAGLLQRRAFQQAVSRARVLPAPRQSERPVVVDLRDPEPVELVRCPLCDVLHDPLWLFRHVAADHP